MHLVVLFMVMMTLSGSALFAVMNSTSGGADIAQLRHARTMALAEDVNRYTDENGGVPPASLSALAASPGYAHVRQYLPASDNTRMDGVAAEGPYLARYALNDGVNNYYRTIVFHIQPTSDLTSTEFLSATYNTCGGTDPSTTSTWCGTTQGYWWHDDTRKRFNVLLTKERQAQQRLLNKFARTYSAVTNNQQVFPDPGTGTNSAVTLISRLSGYTGTATTCSGVWNWGGIPFTCEDLYSVWGTPRVYNYLNEDWIALYVQAPYNEGGSPIVIATQLDQRRTIP